MKYLDNDTNFFNLAPCPRLHLSSTYSEINGYYYLEQEYEDWAKTVYIHENGSETIAYSENYGWTVALFNHN